MMADSFSFTFDTSRLLSEMADAYRRQLRDVTGDPGRRPEIVPFLFRRFELATELVPSNYDLPTTAYAWPLRWVPADGGYVARDADPNNRFLVVDLTGHRRGRARPSSAGEEWNGARGWAVKPHDVDIASGGLRWEIVELQWQARVIEFTVNASGGFSTASATVAVTVDRYEDGYDPDPGDEGLTITNKAASGGYMFEGDYGDKGMARYYPRLNKYRIWQMECP